VNPRIVAASTETSWFFEGCLSFAAVTVGLERPSEVRVHGYDLDGRDVAIEACGPQASLMQHEIDHLDGVLTLDRAHPLERRRAIYALSESARTREAA
jgi:peptide deformylase